jgi:hypothetical protein
MSIRQRYFKDTRRIESYNIYIAQKDTWEKALDVSKKIVCRVSKRTNVFSENFIESLYSFKGEIKSVQKNNYKHIGRVPRKSVIGDIDQFFNRMINLYLDTEMDNTDVFNLIKFEANELCRRCYSMNHKYRSHY